MTGALLVREDGSPVGGRWQAWADRAPGFAEGTRVVVSFANPLGREEPAYTWEKGPLVLARPRDVSRDMFMHELGHHVDYGMNDRARDVIRRYIIGSGAPWRAEGGNSPHELFADAVALLSSKSSGDPVRIRLGPRKKELLRRWVTSPMDDDRLMLEVMSASRRRWAAEDSER